MVELLLNGEPVQFKIDTGAVDITAISEKNMLETGWSHFKRNKKSPPWSGPAKQAPANNAWTIHRHADISTIKLMSRDFHSS